MKILRNIKNSDLVNNILLTVRINQVLYSLLSKWKEDKRLQNNPMFKSEGAFVRTSLEYIMRRLQYYDNQKMLNVFLNDLEYELGYKK